jgi:hypothetical protein
MQRNHALAIDKVVARASVPLVGGAGVAEFPRPGPGTYLVKALVVPDDGSSDVAIGHAEIVID